MVGAAGGFGGVAVVVVAAMLRSVVNELSAFRDSWQLSRDISKIPANFCSRP